MSALKRAAIGAAIGALLVLITHPISRPYYVGYLGLPGDSAYLQTTQYLPENIRTMPRPTNQLEIAYWVLVAAEQMQQGNPLKRIELQRLEKLTAMAAEENSDNAFWFQAQALFQWKLGDKKGALAALARGANCLIWRDHQNVRLGRIHLGLANEQGGVVGWQIAYLYYRRSKAFSEQVADMARSFLAEASTEDKSGLETRYVVIQNARLMRDFSQNVGVGLAGVRMIEEATRLGDESESLTPYKLVLARRDIQTKMEHAGLELEANRALDAFNTNDAWLALVSPDQSTLIVRDLARRTLIAAALPGIFVTMGLMASVAWAAVWTLARFKILDWLLSRKTAPYVGVLIAAGVLWATGLGFAALWTGCCIAIYAFIPRSQTDDEWVQPTPTFRFIIGLIGVALCILFGMFLVGMYAPGIRLLPLLSLSDELGPHSGALLGLTWVCAGFVLLIPAIWSIVKHMEPLKLARSALLELNSGIAISCLILAIVAGPFCVSLDRSAQETLNEVFLNEPTHFIGKESM